VIVYRYIDPDTLVVITLPDVPGPDVLPPCPVCGHPIVQQTIEVGTWGDPFATMPGRWECRNGCDPRHEDPRHVGR
jgi:hypothetical protein